ncbi:unnamed protein product, partial [Phaeothamnion confervicola]
RQVWHNYGFDRHVLFNAPPALGQNQLAPPLPPPSSRRIDCRGFGGDTMHMARLWDSSMEKVNGEGGFSLDALSVKLLGPEYRKVPMKDIFGVSES